MLITKSESYLVRTLCNNRMHTDLQNLQPAHCTLSQNSAQNQGTSKKAVEANPVLINT